MKLHLLFAVLVMAAPSFALTALPMKVSVQTGDTLNFVPFLKEWDTSATSVTVETSMPGRGTVQTLTGWFDSNSFYIPLDTFRNAGARPARLRTPRLYPGFRFIPSAGFTGRDSFTYRIVTSRGNSNTATCAVRVTPPEPGNMTVLLIVNQALNDSLSFEVNRLKRDLENEGYLSRILPWVLPHVNFTPAHAKPVWDSIVAEYDRTDRTLGGVILIGQVPIYREYLNSYHHEYPSAFWCMSLWEPAADADSSIVGFKIGKPGYNGTHYTPGSMNIWVSQFSAILKWGVEVSHLGSEATLIRRALQANHDYRTNASRLPHTAFYHNMYSGGSPMIGTPHHWGRGMQSDRLGDIWPAVDKRSWTDTTSPARYEWRRGGQYWEPVSHGGTAPYHRATLNGGSTITWSYRDYNLKEAIFPIRFYATDCCHLGQLGYLTGQHLLTRSSGCVLAMSATDYVSCGFYLADTGTVFPPHGWTRQRLAQGDRWGRAWLRGNGWIWSVNFHGDLSLKPNMDSANALPAISSLTAVKTGPLSWRFSVSATDRDDGITKYEWWARSYNGGKASPDSAGTMASMDFTYASAALCTVRVEVEDHYKARDWATVIIKTDSGIVSDYLPPTMAQEIAVPEPLRAGLSLSPNPFKPVTRLNFNLAQQGPVKITILDSRGRVVRSYTPIQFQPGPHAVAWDGCDNNGKAAAGGIYCFVIRTNGRLMTARATLMR